MFPFPGEGAVERIDQDDAAATRATSRVPQFASAKFRPPPVPGTLITRPALRARLTAGAGQRLTVAVGSAGAGKSVLLADWAAARPPGTTAWLSCDGADSDPVRFWAGFVEAPRAIEAGFGGDAADLLRMDGQISADVIASVANDAAKLPKGSAIIVDDFHVAAPAVSTAMADLVECWPAESVQLVLASRFEPPLRMQRMRMGGELCEIRDQDLYFSLDDSRRLLASFGVEISEADLRLLYERSEGWPAAVQMAAWSLRGTDPAGAGQALQTRGHTIGEYFVDEVLSQQPPPVTRFMLDTSVLDELTVDACAALTAREDAAALLHGVDAADLFVVALDEDRTSFRYHHLVRQTLRAELRARDPGRERVLQLRAAEWFESAGDARRAARHFMAARQSHRALALLRDKSVADFFRDPARPAPLDVSEIRPESIMDAPDELLALATDLLLSGDIAHGGQYLDLFEQIPSARLEPALEARLAVARAFHCTTLGQLARALGTAMRARVIQRKTQLGDEWMAAVSLILLSVYPCLEIPDAVEREAAATLRMPSLDEPARLVLVPGARALALVESGRLAEGANAAEAAEADAVRLGFDRHFFAVDYLRALAGLALERHDLDTAERLTEQVLSISERLPLFQFLALLDRAKVWAVRGRVREALATVESARQILKEPSTALVARADEQEALLRLSLGDPRSPAELAARLRPGARRDLLLARIALAAGDHRAAQERLHARTLSDLTPRRALEREILLAATAIERGDAVPASILGNVLHKARRQGFLSTVVTTAPQVAEYLIEHAVQLRADPFIGRLTSMALEVRAVWPVPRQPGRVIVEPLTAAEQRVLQHLPTRTYAEIADNLYISQNTVKTHLRSIYQKLGAASRSQAVERALELRLL